MLISRRIGLPQSEPDIFAHSTFLFVTSGSLFLIYIKLHHAIRTLNSGTLGLIVEL